MSDEDTFSRPLPASRRGGGGGGGGGGVSPQDADHRAKGIALEQTVEIPGDIVPAGYISDEIVPQVGWRASAISRTMPMETVISYSRDSAGDEVIQLLNVTFGNSSIQQNIRVTGFEPGPVVRRALQGSTLLALMAFAPARDGRAAA